MSVGGRVEWSGGQLFKLHIYNIHGSIANLGGGIRLESGQFLDNPVPGTQVTQL